MGRIPDEQTGTPRRGCRAKAVLAFAVGTLLITQDLDLRCNDASRRWVALRFVWMPYHLLSKHRGVSHTYLLGLVTRLLYLAAWLRRC